MEPLIIYEGTRNKEHLSIRDTPLCIGLMMASVLYERAARIEHTCHHQTYTWYTSL